MEVDVSTFEQDAPAVSAVQRALLLKTFPGFVGLTGEELGLLAAISTERFFPRGAVMHRPGVPVMAYHLIVEGEVQMYHDGHPSKVFGERSVIGGLAALTRDPEGAHAVALADTLALEIDTEDMQDVFEDNFSILQAVQRAMARTLRELQMQMGGGAVMGADRKHADEASPQPLTLVDKMFFLRRTTNFGDTSIEALAELASDAAEHRYKAGEQIWAVDDKADYSLLIVCGSVECRPADKPPFEFGAGFVVGGLDSLAEEPRWYGCVAKTDIVTLHLKRQASYDLLEDNIDMAMEMLRRFASGITTLMGKMAAQRATTQDSGDAGDDDDD